MGGLMFGAIGDNTIDEYVGAESRSYVGGNALNVAVQLSGLGHGVRYAGAVGPDAPGDRVRATLAARGVLTGGLVTLPGVTSVSRIRVEPSGDRVFEFEDFGVCAAYRPDERELDALAACAAVHIGMLPCAADVRRALSDRGVLVTQDCAVSAGYDHLGVAFCSAGEDEREAYRLARAAVDGGATVAVATCGALGSVGFDGRTWWRVDAAPVAVLDTTGAGDSYVAGFVAARVAGAEVDEAMRAGALVAARTCAHLGAWPQDPLPIR